MPQREMRLWHRKLVDDLARRAEAQAERGMPSKRLRRSLQIQRPSDSVAVLHVPEYWAFFVHYGTQRVTDKLMVWFKDPRNDPRLSPRPPVRRRDIKKLTPAQFRAAREANQLIIAYNRRAIKAVPFFENPGNMAPFVSHAFETIPKRFSQLVRRELKGLGIPTLRL